MGFQLAKHGVNVSGGHSSPIPGVGSDLPCPLSSDFFSDEGQGMREQARPPGEEERNDGDHRGARYQVGSDRGPQGRGAHGGHGAVPRRRSFQLLQVRVCSFHSGSILGKCVSVCVCVYVFIKLGITAQSGPVILLIFNSEFRQYE